MVRADEGPDGRIADELMRSQLVMLRRESIRTDEGPVRKIADEQMRARSLKLRRQNW